MGDYLYHYTCIEHLPDILKDGFLKLTPSDLKRPKRYYWKEVKEGVLTIASDNDDYRPVVWLTDIDKATSENLYGDKDGHKFKSIDAHLKARIIVKKTDEYKLWQDWALKNHMKLDWYIEFRDKFCKGAEYKHYYVIERRIPVTEFIAIEILDEETGEYVDVTERMVA